MATAVETRTAPARATVGSDRTVLGLFTVTTFLGAALLFLVQPMVAKMLLPLLGGTPDVWNTAMVFFQAALLGGYLFAHLSTTRLGLRRHPVVQLVLLCVPLALLPVAVPAGWRPPEDLAPALWTLVVLTVAVGAPFLAVATASPTLQRWFSATGHPHADDPYFLYAAGNVGSLLALLGYPLVLEPRLDLSGQARLWTTGYVVFVALSAACAVVLRRRLAGEADVTPASAESTAANEAPPIPNRTRARWILFAAIPSALMLGVTRHISTDIASIPLLWVIPLALYLVTFIVAFGRDPDRVVSASSRWLRLLIVPVALTFLGTFNSVWLVLLPHLAVFFLAGLLCHGRLASERPAPARLTEFYLWISVGGVLGGIACALVAPVVFTTVVEYPLVLGVALFVRVPTRDEAAAPARSRGASIAYAAALVAVVALALAAQGSGESDGRIGPSMIFLGVAAAVAYVGSRSPRAFAAGLGLVLVATIFISPIPVLHTERTFFGVHRVLEDARGRHLIVNGTTTHGLQDPGQPGTPLGYYHPDGPIGQFFTATAALAGRRDVAVVGLGSGALAAYGRTGDRFTFYEIDQSVADIASDPRWFTYLSDSRADVDVVLGDGRLSLADAPERSYDLLVVDAFSSDAIPVHLLTEEALSLYVSRLADDGVLAFHVSNRYFELPPVLARVAGELGLSALHQTDASTSEAIEAGHSSSQWVLVARDGVDLDAVADDDRWTVLGDGDGTPLWTDDFSDVLSVFRG
jgi:hypothetical protein